MPTRDTDTHISRLPAFQLDRPLKKSSQLFKNCGAAVLGDVVRAVYVNLFLGGWCEITNGLIKDAICTKICCYLISSLSGERHFNVLKIRKSIASCIYHFWECIGDTSDLFICLFSGEARVCRIEEKSVEIQ